MKDIETNWILSIQKLYLVFRCLDLYDRREEIGLRRKAKFEKIKMPKNSYEKVMRILSREKTTQSIKKKKEYCDNDRRQALAEILVKPFSTELFLCILSLFSLLLSFLITLRSSYSDRCNIFSPILHFILSHIFSLSWVEFPNVNHNKKWMICLQNLRLMNIVYSTWNYIYIYIYYIYIYIYIYIYFT